MSAEHVFDSWEDFEESGELDRQLNHFTPGGTAQQTNRAPQIKEDSHRTGYQPQLRILKRPTATDETAQSSQKEKTTQPRAVKTLEEREAAYAEARLRILGPTSGESSKEQNKPQMKQSSSSESQGVGSLENSLSNLRTQAEMVIRQPRGPDGTKGFKDLGDR